MNIVATEDIIYCPICGECLLNDESFDYNYGDEEKIETVINNYCYNCQPLPDFELDISADEIDLIHEFSNGYKVFESHNYTIYVDKDNDILATFENEETVANVIKKLKRKGLL